MRIGYDFSYLLSQVAFAERGQCCDWQSGKYEDGCSLLSSAAYQLDG
jgi:hypothetical protein